VKPFVYAHAWLRVCTVRLLFFLCVGEGLESGWYPQKVLCHCLLFGTLLQAWLLCYDSWGPSIQWGAQHLSHTPPGEEAVISFLACPWDAIFLYDGPRPVLKRASTLPHGGTGCDPKDQRKDMGAFGRSGVGLLSGSPQIRFRGTALPLRRDQGANLTRATLGKLVQPQVGTRPSPPCHPRHMSLPAGGQALEGAPSMVPPPAPADAIHQMRGAQGASLQWCRAPPGRPPLPPPAPQAAGDASV